MKTCITVKRIVFVALLVVTISCSRHDAEWGEMLPGEEDGVIVNLNVSTAESLEVVETRSLSPLPPEKENLIWDIWVFQYDAQGILRERFTQRFRETVATGALKLHSFSALLAPLKNCTVCMVANLNPGEENPPVPWPGTWSEFLDAYVTVPYSKNAGESGLPDGRGLYMFGSYQGDLVGSAESPTGINIALGRMLSRLNLIVTNETGVTLSNLRITIENVKKQVCYYPRTDNPAFMTDTSFVSGLGNAAPGYTKTLYYYIAPNIDPTLGKETRIKVEADKNGALVSATANVGGSPDDATVNRNNNYTISLKLK